METSEPPRGIGRRVRDALDRLERDEDLWLATAGDDRPWLVPLSFHWTGTALLMATARRSRSYANLAAGGGARVALGHTRDVVMLDGRVDLPERLPDDEAAAVAAVTGVDPRSQAGAGYIRFTPVRGQAWRTYEETLQRTIMTDGRWAAER